VWRSPLSCWVGAPCPTISEPSQSEGPSVNPVKWKKKKKKKKKRRKKEEEEERERKKTIKFPSTIHIFKGHIRV
jgi:hypothetical protein